MKRSFRGLLATFLGVAIVACGCVKEGSGDKPQPALPAAERFEVFQLLNPNDIPYRIPALATTKDGTLIAVADYRHSGTDIGVTDKGRIDLHYRLSYDNGNTWTDVMPLIEVMQRYVFYLKSNAIDTLYSVQYARVKPHSDSTVPPR